MRELRIPTRKTNPIHNDVPENTRFLLLDQPSGEANTTGTLISKIDEVAINEKNSQLESYSHTYNPPSYQQTNYTNLIPLSVIVKKCIAEGIYTMGIYFFGYFLMERARNFVIIN
ncbi:hypothetical protein RND81_O163400 [Saponaria officinalis]|uniref:Uncharacterized protein n=1 Tax=Saponaria officinalis TaxID=3572 RepID=A0AAW1G992_SAPOF